MWFKNLQIYRLAGFIMTPDDLAAALAPHTHAPIGANELLRQGWAPVREGGALVQVANHQLMLRFDTESRNVPTSVINRAAKARAAELEEQQGFPPGKKAMKELKERVADELLPRAFPKLTSTYVWIDRVNGWLVIDSPTPARADDVVKALLKCFTTAREFPLESLRVNRSPVATMTGWLESDEAPHNFTVDQDAELRATGESRAAVRYVKHSLDPEDVRRHIAAGKQCVRLAMTWNSRVSFVLDESLAVKSVRPLDILQEGRAITYNDEERFDNDLVLMTGELAHLLSDLVDALGGMVPA